MLIVILAGEADRAAAAQVAKTCAARGYPALVYTPASVTAPDVSNADAVVVVCSPMSIHSSWLEGHAQEADGLGKPLVLVALQGVEAADLGGETFAWIDDEASVLALIEAALKGKAPQAVSAAPPVLSEVQTKKPSRSVVMREPAGSSPQPGAGPAAPSAPAADPSPPPPVSEAAPAILAPAALPPPAVKPAPPALGGIPPAQTQTGGSREGATLEALAELAWKKAAMSSGAPPPAAPAAPPKPEAATSAMGGLSAADLLRKRGPIALAGGEEAFSGAGEVLPAPSTAPYIPQAPASSESPGASPPAMAQERWETFEAPERGSHPTPARGKSKALGPVSGVAVLIAAGGLAYAFNDRLAGFIPGLAEKLLAVLGLSKGAMPPLPGAVVPAEVRSDLVDCSVFAPPSVARTQPFMVQVFLHTIEQEERVAFLAASMDEDAKLRGRQTLQVPIARGQRVRVELDGQGVATTEPVQELVWRGEPNVAAFSCVLPEGVERDTVHPVVRVYVDDFPVGRVLFQVKGETVSRAPTSAPVPELAGTAARRYRTAFLSYASPDRVEVLKRAQALRVAKIDFFQDVLSLEPGERYERRIYERIPEADIFMLFWSRHARESTWVGKEIDYARACQFRNENGLPDIVPVVLDDPRDAPPPELLGDRHFNDTIAALISYEERRPKETGGFLSRWFGRQ